MIGVVLVSHSKALAQALAALVRQMAGADFPVAVAAGVGDDFAELGTDAVHIADVLRPFCAGEGAVVLMDLGSAVLSAEMALELLDADGVATPAAKLRLVPAPLVEAAVAAAVAVRTGAGLDAVVAEAMAALTPKLAQLGGDSASVSEPPVAPGQTGPAVVVETEIANRHGLHARPAATLVQALAGLAVTGTIENVSGGRGPGSLASLSAVALVQARRGDRVRFNLCGADSEIAATRLRALIADQFGEAGAETEDDAAPAAPPQALPRWQALSEGIALGRGLALAAAMPSASAKEACPPAEEWARLEAALTRVAAEMRQPGAGGAIFAAQELLLRDPALLEPVRARLRDGGVCAERAWAEASAALAQAYATLDDEYLRGRAVDVLDVATRVGQALAGNETPALIAPDPPAVLLVEELLPSQAQACRPGAVLGIVARRGSPTAHAALIIRGLGIPMVAGPWPDGLVKAAVIGLDGGRGEVWLDPGPGPRATIARRQQELARARQAAQAGAHGPAITTDGVAIQVLANVGSEADAVAVAASGAEGVGLLRTELVYLSFAQTPSEDEQVAALARVLAPLGPGPVVVRTPDIGADKPAPYLSVMAEANPFLGVRGLRLSLRDPDFFASNLRAILRAGVGRALSIMLPMVSTAAEMAWARHLLAEAHDALLRRDLAHAWPVRLGMMVEVPAAVLMADTFVTHADFFSIGTNDLTQYVLAAERGNAALSGLHDAAQPALLRLVRELCAKGHAAGRPVSVCGDAASEPLTAALLIGVGLRSLSVRPPQVGAIKALIRRCSAAHLAELANRAAALDDAAAVRALMAPELAALGLG